MSLLAMTGNVYLPSGAVIGDKTAEIGQTRTLVVCLVLFSLFCCFVLHSTLCSMCLSVYTIHYFVLFLFFFLCYPFYAAALFMSFSLTKSVFLSNRGKLRSVLSILICLFSLSSFLLLIISCILVKRVRCILVKRVRLFSVYLSDLSLSMVKA
jgi:hypothetical protein